MKILAAEDNPVFQTMLRNLLTKWGYEAVIVSDGDQAWRHLEGPDPPPLAILDWMMPGADGVELCRRVRASVREPYTYIILLTARTQSEDLVEGIEAGADDYLTKPFNAHELRARLRAGQRILDLQKELLTARETLRQQAMQDALTGLWNHGAIFELLDKELARTAREHTSVAVLMVDLDHFKSVNDVHGHLAGDVVLKEAVRRMKNLVRRSDFIGRYGGEEFLVVLPNCESVDATAQAERLRQALAASPVDLPGGSLAITASIGVACAGGSPIPRADTLVREADEAMYMAKNNGRNRVEFAGRPVPV
jgi:diguanylate cyclase (GGDEF)-like protein